MDAHQGSKRPLLNTMLDAVSMRLPPHSTVAHMGRGVTPHCSWHLSMDSFKLKGCRACHVSGVCQIFLAPHGCGRTGPSGLVLRFGCRWPAAEEQIGVTAILDQGSSSWKVEDDCAASGCHLIPVHVVLAIPREWLELLGTPAGHQSHQSPHAVICGIAFTEG